eukprot:5402674-Ditylum_brightwellii.AAC.1
MFMVVLLVMESEATNHKGDHKHNGHLNDNALSNDPGEAQGDENNYDDSFNDENNMVTRHLSFVTEESTEEVS